MARRLFSALLGTLAVVLLAAFSASAELKENPDAPVGVIGLSFFFNQSIWGDYVGTVSSPGLQSITEADPDYEQVYRDYGMALVVPVHNRVTFHGSASRRTGHAEDTEIVDLGGVPSSVTVEDDQKAWHVGAGVTFWLGGGASAE